MARIFSTLSNQHRGDCTLLGANRLHSRLLFVADSAKLVQNTTNPIMSINPAGSIDCTSTDSTVRLPASFNGAIYTGGTFNVSLRSICVWKYNIK